MGVKWDAKSDNLGFALAHIDLPKAQNTKRGILKRLAALYNPLGWASPYVVRAKILLQRTWSRGLQWDEQLLPDLAIEWQKWEEEMIWPQSFLGPALYLP